MKDMPRLSFTEPPAIPARIRRLVVGAAVLLTASGLIGTALSPYLLVEHPLLLIGLNPDSRHLLLAAGRVELWQAVLVGAARRGLNFMSVFALASIYGRLMLGRLQSKRPWMQSITKLAESIYQRIGVWLVVLVPLYWVAALAGISRLSWRKFAAAIIPGQVAFVFAFVAFGEAIEDRTEPIITFMASHLVEATLAAAVLVATQQLWTRLRKRAQGRQEPTLLI